MLKPSGKGFHGSISHPSLATTQAAPRDGQESEPPPRLPHRGKRYFPDRGGTGRCKSPAWHPARRRVHAISGPAAATGRTCLRRRVLGPCRRLAAGRAAGVRPSGPAALHAPPLPRAPGRRQHTTAPARPGRQGPISGGTHTPPRTRQRVPARLRLQVYRRSVRHVAKMSGPGGRRPRNRSR